MGILYVVATPIGNLSDVTLRALEVLKSSDAILSEDTRETKKLLDKYNINAFQISYRDQNHKQVISKILELLEKGKNLVLVSDSGTPLISDPGFKLVGAVRAKNGKVVPIPGASSITAALSAAGLPTDKFIFLGFLPKKAAAEKMLKLYGELDTTLVIFESPFRVRKLLGSIRLVLGNRYIGICRELTKIHEEVLTGSVSELLEKKFNEKGEFVVLVAKDGYIPR